MRGPQPHPVTPGGATTPVSDAFQIKRGGDKKRGNYNCGRCGLPKKGHSCHLPKTIRHATTPNPAATPSTDSASSSVAIPSPFSAARPPPPPSHRQPCSNLRRALSFDDIDVRDSRNEEEEEFLELEGEPDLGGSGKLPMSCLWEVLRRLPPPALLSAARVCKGWRDTAKRLWRAAEELRLRVPAKSQIGFVGSVLHKCPGLVRLSLRMERLGFGTTKDRISGSIRQASQLSRYWQESFNGF